jgi:hypothetical protein
VKRVLLTTVHRPLGVESETCTSNIQAEMYHAQLTRAQGPFSIRSVCTGWGIEFIAANLDTPVTVMHYPTKRAFLKELSRGYDYVGVSFVICTYPKTVEICRLVREAAPATQIVLGGYGTVLRECDAIADHVCREEGAGFMRRLLGEPVLESFRFPRIRRRLEVMSATARPETILPAGLGCSRGCDFCCTSHFFHRRHVPLLRTGREIHEAIRSVDDGRGGHQNVGIIDEDFLADRARIEELIALNSREVERPVLFSCLTSVQSVAQYTDDELLAMGLSGVWLGVESGRARYPKLLAASVPDTFSRLQRLGIVTVASMIVGFDWHDEPAIEEDFQYLLSLEPCFSQFMVYSPCPQTPLYSRMKGEDRLLDVPYKLHDGFHALFRHPILPTERLEAIVDDLFRREHQALGPSVCRVLETQLAGWTTLKDRPEPLLRSRAREHRALALEIHPVLGAAIGRAPSPAVRARLRNLKERVEDSFEIPYSVRLRGAAAPALALYTALRDRFQPNRQPPSTISRYRQEGLA